jgi:hypothetical protein
MQRTGQERTPVVRFVLHCRSGWGAFNSSLRSTEMAERSSLNVVRSCRRNRTADGERKSAKIAASGALLESEPGTLADVVGHRRISVDLFSLPFSFDLFSQCFRVNLPMKRGGAGIEPENRFTTENLSNYPLLKRQVTTSLTLANVVILL